RRQCRLPTRIHLPAMIAQSSKSMAGAITVAEVITMDGAEVITMDGGGGLTMEGVIITIGETSLPSGNHSGRSRLSLAAFSFEPLPRPNAKAAKVSLDGLCRSV